MQNDNSNNDDKNKSKSIDDDLSDDTPDAYKLYKYEVKTTNTNIYLSENISGHTDYYEIFELLRNSKKGDTVTFILNNYGGYINTGVQLINFIDKSKAKVKMVVAGPVYSMASLLALVGEEIEIFPHTFLMFHDYSGGEKGKGHEMMSAIVHFKPYFDKILKDTCTGFLTDREIKRIQDGKDLYVPCEDTGKRLERHFKQRRK